MDEESIAAEPSEDNGNVPAEEVGNISEESPSEQLPEEPKGEEPKAEADTSQVEPELYELPDGRKVDAETLSREWKENFLPEFTRKSQALKALDEKKDVINKAEEKPYQDPDWTPQTYAELIELAKQEVKQDLEQSKIREVEHRKALEDAVITELTELKKQDPTLNENSLFLHANEYRDKYGVSFPNLTAAYKHMKDVQSLTKTVQQTTAKNIAKRSDPVSIVPGNTGTVPDPSSFGTAVEFLRGLTK